MSFGYQFDSQFLLDHLPGLVSAALIDVRVATSGFVVGACLGLLLALMRSSPARFVRVPAAAYTLFVSSIPHYVLLLWIYFGLATSLNLVLSPVQAITVSVALIAAAYSSETFRAGLAAIDKGQFEAARMIGLGTIQAYRDVILPQAVRIVVPPLGNIFIMVLKGATIMSIISAPDIVFLAQELNVKYFRPFETYTAVAAILVVIVLVCSAIINVLERRLKLPT
jgi:glutamine transport system permease protein